MFNLENCWKAPRIRPGRQEPSQQVWVCALSEPRFLLWEWWGAGAARKCFVTRVSHSGWRTERVALPVLLAHLSGLGDVLNATNMHFSSDVSTHTFGEKWSLSWLAKCGIKTHLLTELWGLNETSLTKHLALCLARRKQSTDVSVTTCSVIFIAREIIIFNFNNLCQIAFQNFTVDIV